MDADALTRDDLIAWLTLEGWVPLLYHKLGRGEDELLFILNDGVNYDRYSGYRQLMMHGRGDWPGRDTLLAYYRYLTERNL